MQRLLRWKGWLAFLSLSSACAHEAHQSGKDAVPRCESSREAIRATIDALISADNRADLLGVMSSYTRDVVFLPPTGEEVSGSEAIEARYQHLFATPKPRIRMEIAEIQLGNEWAFVRGNTQGTLTMVRTGEVTTLNDRFVALLQCDRDAWKISRLIWHPARINSPH